MSPSTLWPTPRRSGLDEIRAVQAHAQPPHVARVRRCAASNPARPPKPRADPAERLHGTAIARARSGDSRTVIEAHRALLAHDLAGVGDPGRRLQPGELSSTRNAGTDAGSVLRPSVELHHLARPDIEGHRRIPHRRRIEDRPLVARAGLEPAAGETPRQVQRQRRRLGQLADFAARAARRGHRQAKRRCPSTWPRTVDRAGPGIERELEGLESEGAVHAGGGADGGGASARRGATSAAGRPPAARARRRSRRSG